MCKAMPYIIVWTWSGETSLPEKIELAFSQFLHTILDSKLELCYIICSLYFYFIYIYLLSEIYAYMIYIC